MTGLREWKKRATRQMISDVATEMIMERGFDAVGVREIARAAHVSPTTLFAYFPSKEAMFIDRGEELSRELMAAVRDRPAGVTALESLKALTLGRMGIRQHPQTPRFTQLIRDTPQLAAYWRELSMQDAEGLTRVLAEAWDRMEDDPYPRVVARAILDLRDQAIMADADPAYVEATFDLLERGLPFDAP